VLDLGAAESKPPNENEIAVARGSGLEETRRARGLVSSRRSGARVDAGRIEPSDALKGWVETFWHGAWDLRGESAHRTELIGDPCVHLVYEGSPKDLSARVVGVWTRLWTRTLSETGHVFGVKLRSGCASAILGAPIARLNNTIAPLEELLPDAPAPCEVLSHSGVATNAVERLSAWLERNGSVSEENRLAHRAIRLIEEDVELTRVESVARSLSLSVRALQRLFRDHVGATPKQVLRRHRLQEAAGTIERGEELSLAQLAMELGYSDQAHLTRDFKAMVGKSPGEFRRAVWE
ncbi:MAG: helix-turn-helix transcriptional regulator, partial [Myxococcota bacterium]